MKWIKLENTYYNADQITSIAQSDLSNKIIVTFKDGKTVITEPSDLDKILDFCGNEVLELSELQTKVDI